MATANQPRIVEVRANLLKKNDLLAHALRARFQEAGVTVVSLVSSPGSGKTTLLQRTLAVLSSDLRVGVIVGDLQTDNDARRLASAGVPVRQITTGTVCHLDAEMIGRSLEEWAAEGWPLDAFDLLFLENVGNLVCPASYDLGEALRVVLLSVTEGEDKPLKYPTIFNSADIAVITKIDLAGVVGFNRDAAYRAIESVRPGLEVLEVSAATDAGLNAWTTRLRGVVQSASTARIRLEIDDRRPVNRFDRSDPQAAPLDRSDGDRMQPERIRPIG